MRKAEIKLIHKNVANVMKILVTLRKIPDVTDWCPFDCYSVGS